MKSLLRILLPVTGNKDIELFEGLPAQSLLQGNLAAAAELYKLELCLLAPSDAIDRFLCSDRRASFEKYASLRAIPIDDLVVDGPFDVIPSLAYWRGMSDCGSMLTDTAFIFFQSNLVLSKGALGAAAQRFIDGKRVLTATFLHADHVRLERRLAARGSCAETELSARTLVEEALQSLDVREYASIMNVDLPSSGHSSRLFWKHGDGTLIGFDFKPYVLGLRPNRSPGNIGGFRDTSFAEAFCPDGPTEHIIDSDHLVGVELTQFVGELDPSFGSDRFNEDVRSLSMRSTAYGRAAALHSPVVFHARDVSRGVSRTRALGLRYVRRLLKAIESLPIGSEGALWEIEYYLWAVRRFELGHGSMPSAPFDRLFASREGARARLVSGAGRLIRLARIIRQRMVGHVPTVTVLHPLWLDYKLVAKFLRIPSDQILHAGDGAAVLSQVLGPPAFSVEQIMNGLAKRGSARTEPFDGILINLSAASLPFWDGVVLQLLPLVKSGKQILVFHQSAGSFEGNLSGSLMAGASRISSCSEVKLSATLVPNTAYREWLQRGYQVCTAFVRHRRTAKNFVKAAALLSLLSALVAIDNLVRLFRSGDGTPRYSSVTIVVEKT